MHIEPLNLSHQKLLKKRLHDLQPLLSEYSFANLYLFRQLHRYQVITDQGEVFIQGMTRDHVSYLMLTSEPTKVSLTLLHSLMTRVQILFPIPDKWLPFLESSFSQIIFKEADSDYLFATSKLAHFPGRHLSNKRNLVSQLLNQHEVKAENLSTQFSDAKHILEKWENQENHKTETDYTSCLEALERFKELHLHGRILYIDQQPAGFTIGEWISKECYVVHFGKALRSIKGLYQYLYQDLAQAVEGTCTWMNLEADLGIPSLHNAKHSYLPDQMLHKWRLSKF